MEEEEEKRKWRSIIEEDEEEEGEKESEEVIIRSTVTFDLLVQTQLDINLQDVQFGNDSFFTAATPPGGRLHLGAEPTSHGNICQLVFIMDDSMESERSE